MRRIRNCYSYAVNNVGFCKGFRTLYRAEWFVFANQHLNLFVEHISRPKGIRTSHVFTVTKRGDRDE